MKRLQKSFFLRDNVYQIAQDLLGKYLFTKRDGQLTGGMISEVEVCENLSEDLQSQLASFEGGVLFMQSIENKLLVHIVTNVENKKSAILVRSLVPTHGEELMLLRTGYYCSSPELTDDPSKVSRALGLSLQDNGCSLTTAHTWLEDREA